jgi:hypothetical protein
MQKDLHVFDVQGRELEKYLLELGQLLISVYRDYPYLYDSGLDLELEYI